MDGMQYDVLVLLKGAPEDVQACLDSLIETDYDPGRLHLILMGPGAKGVGSRYAANFGKVTPVEAEAGHKDVAALYNMGAAGAAGRYLLFLDGAAEVDPCFFAELDRAVERSPEAGGFECRALPADTRHHIDPVTLESPVVTGPAYLFRRDTFEMLGGFDRRFFTGWELDLSLRMRASGLPLEYLPLGVVYMPAEEGETLEEYAGRYAADVLLACKYGGPGVCRDAQGGYLREMKTPKHYAHVRRAFLDGYLRCLRACLPLWFWRLGNRTLRKAVQKMGFLPDEQSMRGKGFLKKPLEEGPSIGVVVRTVNRPELLRRALRSLANQTYKNFRVAVVEDGEACSREVAEEEFSQLDLCYIATGEKTGRGRAGNTGLRALETDYLSFLDDDDLLYPDHLELLAARALEHPEADLVLGTASVMKIHVLNREPYIYEMTELFPMHFDRVNLFTMAQTCQIPIQSAIFKRSLFEAHGGLREDIDGNEDWAMWMVLLKHGIRMDPEHVDIDRSTSIFVQDADESKMRERIEYYKQFNEVFFYDPEMKFTVTLAELRGYYDDMVADFRHVVDIGQVEKFLEEQDKRNG